jgi:transposase
MGSYSQEFKDQVVELHRRDGRSFMDLAKEFNLSATTVANWARAADRRAPRRESGKEPPAESDQAKIARLERELSRKEEELEILGKALAFFARRADR